MLSTKRPNRISSCNLMEESFVETLARCSVCFSLIAAVSLEPFPNLLVFFFFFLRPPVTPSTPSPLSAPSTHGGVWFLGGRKGLFSMRRLDGFYLPNGVLNLQSGFGGELLPAGGAGISSTTSRPLWHRWHSTQEERQGMDEAGIRKLEDIIKTLPSLNGNSNRQTLPFV